METSDFQLLEAAKEGDVARVKELIKRGVPIDSMKVRFIVLMAHNWQKWKSRFLTCPCLESYREEVVGLKNTNYNWKITIFVNM